MKPTQPRGNRPRVVVALGGNVLIRRGEDADVDAQRHNVDQAMDKDLSAALLGRELDADMFLLLTDVTAIQRGFGSADGNINRATPSMLRGLDLPAGSMGAKAEAASRFVERTASSSDRGTARRRRDRRGTCGNPGNESRLFCRPNCAAKSISQSCAE